MKPWDRDFIDEINAPGRAYIEIWEDEICIRISYNIVSWSAKSLETLDTIYRDFIDDLHYELKRIAAGKQKIIWWRTRLEYDPNPLRFYCRLATTPKLPQAFWDKWEKKEGQPAREAKELVKTLKRSS